MKTKKAPRFLQPYLWSYDINRIDIKKDKKLIIQQVLNFGTEKEVKWIFETYDKKEIRGVLKDPKRGMWDKKSLNFWKTILEINMPKNIYKKAICNINPQSN